MNELKTLRQLYDEGRAWPDSELQAAYLLMQTNCGIQVGDTVNVLRDPLDREQGWNNDAVTGYAGKQGVVVDMPQMRPRNGIPVYFKDEDAWFYFPWFVLEKIPKPHWRDTVSKENPVLCYIRDYIDQEWPDELNAVTGFSNLGDYVYRTSGGGWRYAKRVPREVLEKMLEGYDETGDDE